MYLIFNQFIWINGYYCEKGLQPFTAVCSKKKHEITEKYGKINSFCQNNDVIGRSVIFVSTATGPGPGPPAAGPRGPRGHAHQRRGHGRRDLRAHARPGHARPGHLVAHGTWTQR